jgi:hypothetical protein
MADKRILFARILHAELEDIGEDIQHLEVIFKGRFESQEIGDYVYRENSALLEREAESIRGVISWLEGENPESYRDAEAILAALNEFVRSRVEAKEYPEAISVFLKRKTAKALNYVESDYSAP